MKAKSFLIYILCLMAAGCSDIGIPVSDPQLVVEGWIEDGGYPVVIVTTTVPVSHEVKDINQLKDYIVTWGKVSITDGTDTVVMTGRSSRHHFPPYIYTTYKMTGEVGKTYKIKVEYGGKTATATTTIPEPAVLEYLKVSGTEETGFSIVAGLEDNPEQKNYYKSFVKLIGKDSTYTPSFMGLINDDILTEVREEISINNSPNNLYEKRNTRFSSDDDIMIRFCTMDETSYNYWSDFDDITSLSKNPFFPVTAKIRSNVNGGLGYWAGYGTTYYHVSIPDSLSRGRIH